MRVRLLERLGRMLRFRPAGRRVRVWVEGWPGEEESKVELATVAGVFDGVGVLEFEPPLVVDSDEVRFARVAPRERGFGLDALWFSFIAVDAAALDGPDPDGQARPLGRWAIRLG